MRVSILIPTKDRPELLQDTLEHINLGDPPPHEVLVVDASEHHSAGPVVRAAATARPDISYRHLTGTRGACRQRNLGLTEAQGDLIAFLDDDVRIPRDTWAQVAAAFTADPALVGLTGKLDEPSPRRISLKHSPLRRLIPGAGEQGTFTAYGYPNRLWDVDEPHDVEVFTGCFMAVRAADARAVGFDERLESGNGYASLDDEDFSKRLARRGRMHYDPRLVIEHRNTGFSTARSRQFNRDLVRNRAYTFRKNFRPTPLTWVLWWCNMALHVAHRAVNRDWHGVRGLGDGLVEVARGRR